MAEDVVTIQLRFGVETVLGLFQDTLSFSEDDWAKRDSVAVDAAKQARADDWVTFRSAQIAEEEALRTREGRQARISELDMRIADLAATRARLEAEVAASVVER